MDEPSERDEDNTKEQQMGSCTQQVIQSWLHHTMPDALYRNLKAGWTTNTSLDKRDYPCLQITPTHLIQIQGVYGKYW